MTERGDFKDCPLIIGFNKDEGTLYMPYIFPDYAQSKEAPYVDQETFNVVSNRAVACAKFLGGSPKTLYVERHYHIARGVFTIWKS